MTGRTNIDPATGERRVMYVCSSYVTGKCTGQESPCGYHAISHKDAEKLLRDKIDELNLQLDKVASEQARASFKEQLAKMGDADKESLAQCEAWLQEGMDALLDYMKQTNFGSAATRQRLVRLAREQHWGRKIRASDLTNLPFTLGKVQATIKAAEDAEVKQAGEKVAKLTAEHTAYTKAWVAASELQKTVLKAETDRIEAELHKWMPRTLALSKRLDTLMRGENERREEGLKLQKDWPNLEKREKGEALRRRFRQVKLYWEPMYHKRLKNPTRPHKTKRQGRFSYALKTDRIEWSFEASNLLGSS